MKKFYSLLFIACAAVMISCGGNANKATQETTEDVVVVEEVPAAEEAVLEEAPVEGEVVEVVEEAPAAE